MKDRFRRRHPVLELRSRSLGAPLGYPSLRQPRTPACILWLPRLDVLVLMVGLASLLTVSGCRRSEPDFEVLSLPGKIEKLDVRSDETGEITLLYYSEKHGQEMIGTGVVTKETEIMINGAIAKLSDLREGDRVRGEVRIEKRQGEKIQTALKIYVDRPEPAGDP